MIKKTSYFFLLLFLFVLACKKEDDNGDPTPGLFQLSYIKVGTVALSNAALTNDAPIDKPIVASFTNQLDTAGFHEKLVLTKKSGEVINLAFSFLDNGKTVSAKPLTNLEKGTLYEVTLSDKIQSTEGHYFPGESFEFNTQEDPVLLVSATVDGKDLLQVGSITDVDRLFTIELKFSEEIDLEEFKNKFVIVTDGQLFDIYIKLSPTDPTTFILTANEEAAHFTKLDLAILPNLKTKSGKTFEGYNRSFYSELDPTPKFPIISDEELLTLVQSQTFRYFWDFAHPVSGMARERNTSGDLVTSGGSGFGLMAIVVGMERGFITRAEGIERLEKIIGFLSEKADRFHGAWPHWMNGVTGSVIPFGADDNGGDLVETSFLVMGLLTVRQYLEPANPQEQALIDTINQIWQEVEWDWYRQNSKNILYWHWSPNFGWVKNHRIEGYNEALITYVLAAASPTHTIPAEVYHEGWARNGGIVNGKSYYGITLPVGFDYGGPLFFEQYTYLGLNPTNLQDQYANYWQQCVNHTLINREHCIINPYNYVGYSDACWGLTASDNQSGYSAHSPTNDLGVITPTAALSSFPFTPEYSMDALHFFYYTVGDRLWGPYGFHDAFNPTAGWWADSYLAIDQGPIVGMIENHRTGLLWDLFMSCPEVQQGLTKLGFTF